MRGILIKPVSSRGHSGEDLEIVLCRSSSIPHQAIHGFQIRYAISVFPHYYVLCSNMVIYVDLNVSYTSCSPLDQSPHASEEEPRWKFPHLGNCYVQSFLVFFSIFSMLRRFSSREESYTEICEGIYVGGWPSSPDKLPPGDPAIVDSTCEFPRASHSAGNAYFCVPTWDTGSPQPSEFEMAVLWACRKREQKRPVFVHCAYGMT